MNVWTYIKGGFVLILLTFIILDTGKDSVSNAKIETVTKNVVAAAGFQDIEPAEARMVKRFYGINPKDYDGVSLYVAGDNMDVHELLIVKLNDVSQQESVEASIEERLDTQLKSFEGYGAEQTALLKKSVLEIRGNYVFYMVGEKASDAQKAFIESL